MTPSFWPYDGMDPASLVEHEPERVEPERVEPACSCAGEWHRAGCERGLDHAPCYPAPDEAGHVAPVTTPLAPAPLEDCATCQGRGSSVVACMDVCPDCKGSGKQRPLPSPDADAAWVALERAAQEHTVEASVGTGARLRAEALRYAAAVRGGQ